MRSDFDNVLVVSKLDQGDTIAAVRPYEAPPYQNRPTLVSALVDLLGSNPKQCAAGKTSCEYGSNGWTTSGPNCKVRSSMRADCRISQPDSASYSSVSIWMIDETRSAGFNACEMKAAA
jgi:hypothetical protein